MTPMSVCGLQIQDMFEGDIGINARPSSRITFSTAAMTVFNMQEQMSSKKKWRDYFFLQCRAQTTNLNNKLQWFFIFYFFSHCQLLFAVSILSIHALYFY